MRTNLASVILQMKSLGLGDVGRFGFVDPPDARNVRAGVQLLQELGALDGDRLTRLGRKLARLPIDPRLGRMILEADRLGCVREVLVIAAALSIQDPRERPVDQQTKADQFHARFRDPKSDFLGWLNLWRYLREKQGEMGSSAFRRLCRTEFLNYVRVREWQDYESQLRQVAKSLDVKVGRPADLPDADGIHQALLSGLLSHIGLRDPDRRDYLGARGARFSIFPGSGVFKTQPQFLMAAELVETSRLWGRQNAAIDPLWAERLGRHLVKRSWSEPHWSIKRAAVMAYERVTLYGVPLAAERLVNHAQNEPEVARELFIRHALVQGEWKARHDFLATNRRLLEEAEELEHRARRRDIVVDEETLFDFYDARIPAGVVSGAHFDTWWKKARRERPDLLTFDLGMLVRDENAVNARDFPEVWREGSLELPLNYQFDPEQDDDGVTIDLPLATLNTVDPTPFTWHVPGLREELVTALIRSLPKQLRVHFVPAPNTAREFLAAVAPGEESLTDALSAYLRSRTGVHVPPEAWRWDALPAHLRPTFRITDEDGSVVAAGKDLRAVIEPLRPAFESAVATLAEESGLRVTGQTAWTMGTLPTSFVEARAGHEVRGFPALTDEGTTVGVQVYGDAEHRRRPPPARPAPAGDAGRPGSRPPLRPGQRHQAGAGRVAVPERQGTARPTACSPRWGRSSTRAARSATRTRSNGWSRRTRERLPEAAASVLRTVLDVLDAWRAADSALRGRADLHLLGSLADMKEHLARLVGPGFVAEAGAAALREHPRYLRALVERRARLDADPARDQRLMMQVDPLQQAYLHQSADGPLTERLSRVRWMLEEYRVSLWAQHLGTAQTVSDARIRKQLQG